MHTWAKRSSMSPHLQAISTAGGGPGWIATNVNQAHLDYFFWTLLVLMVRGVWGWAAKSTVLWWSAPCLPATAPPSHPGASLPPPTPQFLDFLLFLHVSSRFRYRQLPHATVGVEALAFTPDFKSGVGLTLAMSASERRQAGRREAGREEGGRQGRSTVVGGWSSCRRGCTARL